LFIRASLEAGGVEATQSQGGHRMKLHANARLSVKGRELLVVVLCKRLVKAVDDRSFHAKAHADAQNRDCPCQGSGAIVSGTAANKATEAALAAYPGGSSTVL
jgi:hypothetical protein